MNINLALKATYFQYLSDIGIPLYDAFSVRENASYPYAVISSITASERIPNGCKIYNCEVLIDVVTGFPSATGMNQAWDISEMITNIVNPDNFADLNANVNGWEIGETRLIGSIPNQFISNNYFIYRNLLSFSHIVHKKS